MEKPLPPDTSLHIPVSNGYIIAVLACSGFYTWEVAQSLRVDWKVVTGRRGCRWGAAVLYFPLRSVALLHFVCSMSLLFPPPWQPKNIVDVRYTRESTAMIPRTCTYHIIVLYIVSLWDFWILSWALSALILALWIVNAIGISRMQTEWFLDTMPHLLSIILICVSTLLFALFLSGLFRIRSKYPHFASSRRTRYAKTPLWYMMWKEKLHLILLIWAAQIVTSIAGLSGFNTVPWSIADITCYTIIVTCGGRLYHHSIRRGNRCPTLSFPCFVSSVVRSGLKEVKHRDSGTRTSAIDTPGANTRSRRLPGRQQQVPVLRVVTENLHAQGEEIEMMTLKTETSSSPSTGASPKMTLNTRVLLQPGASSSTSILPPNRAPSPFRVSKTSHGPSSPFAAKDARDRGGAG